MASPRSGICISGGSPRAARPSAFRCRASCRPPRVGRTGSTGWRSAPGGGDQLAAGRELGAGVARGGERAPSRLPSQDDRPGPVRPGPGGGQGGWGGRRGPVDGGRARRGVRGVRDLLVGGRPALRPPLALGILPGVARARLEELAGRIDERRLGPEALGGRSLFVANAARGVVPVSSFQGRKSGARPRNHAHFGYVLVLTRAPRTR